MGANEKLYTEDHVKAYTKATGLMSVEDTLKNNELYNDARIEALNTMKGKRVKDYNHAIDLMTDALIKFRKASKHPHASDKEEDRHHYADYIRNFMEQYAKQNNTSTSALDKKFKLADWKEVFDTLMDSEKQSVLESKIDYHMRKLIQKKQDVIKGIAEYHLEQNPDVKKSLDKAGVARIKTDYDVLINYLKGHRQKLLEQKLNDYKVPEKEDPKVKKK